MFEIEENVMNEMSSYVEECSVNHKDNYDASAGCTGMCTGTCSGSCRGDCRGSCRGGNR